MTNILVVDDEQDLANFLVDELTANGHTAGTAVNGLEAVLNILDGGWDAVIMDIRMPKLDGLGALRLMRRISPKTPVIMFTGQAGQGDMLESMRQGAFTCLLKPVSVERLLTTLEQALSKAVQTA
jgi:two-component system response regulator AtoC